MAGSAGVKSAVTDERTRRLLQFYTQLTPELLTGMGLVYSEHARFIDPFNEVQGLPAIRRVFEHMFQTLQSPRFEVLHAFTEGDTCLLLWHFHFRRTGQSVDNMLKGMSHLRYGPDGRVLLHHDHWDPARQLYEPLPVLGAVMRWLRRRLAAPA